MTVKEILQGKLVTLERFSDEHIPGLKAIALDRRIWEQFPFHIHDEQEFEEYIQVKKDRIANGLQIGFVVKDNSSGQLCGSTNFLNMDLVNRSLEIGTTWLSPSVWGTGINTEAKLLLLTACFEQLDIARVEIRTREPNIRSQKAIEKIGFIREGVLRHHRINPDGTFRNSILYSIIKPDWPQVKQHLNALLNNKQIPA
jgi:N-acetyltransferase